MKQVILIHAHKDIDQLNGLIAQLRDDDFLFYVNLDRKSTLQPASVDPAATLVRHRIDIHWGDFSQVEATLNSLTQIIAEVPAFDKVIFLSAQDAPLLPNAELKRQMAELAGHELLDCVPIGQQGWSCAYRYQYFHRDHRAPLARMACRIANRALRAAGLTRQMVNHYQPWGGSSWWALSRQCIVSLLASIEADPRIVRFFRSVACSDELFFQTLVMNSLFRPRVLAQNFRYIQWPTMGARNPQVLTAADFAPIAAANAHFCRKLESHASAALMPLLDQLRQSRENPPPASSSLADPALPDSPLPDPPLPDPALPDSALPDPLLPDITLPDPALPDPALPYALPDPALPDPALTNPPLPDPALTNPPLPDPPLPDPPLPDPALTNPPLTNPPLPDALPDPALPDPARINPPLANPPLANSPLANPTFPNRTSANPPLANSTFTNRPSANPPLANPPLFDLPPEKSPLT